MSIPFSIALILVAFLSPGASILLGIILFIGAFLFAVWQEKDLTPDNFS